MKKSLQRHEIAGLLVEMTASQAERWNSGQSSTGDYRQIKVYIPISGNDYRKITLSQALKEFDYMIGRPANKIY